MSRQECLKPSDYLIVRQNKQTGKRDYISSKIAAVAIMTYYQGGNEKDLEDSLLNGKRYETPFSYYYKEAK